MHIKATCRGIKSILQHNTAALKLNKSSKISERDWLQYFQLHAGKLCLFDWLKSLDLREIF